MDMKHIDMQYLGIFEIFKETYKIMNKNRKNFALAALCFIHPLNYILSSLIGTLNHLLKNLHEYGNISHIFSHNHWSYFWPFNVFCIIFFCGCSIFSTAGVSVTVNAVYTGRDLSINDTMSLVAKVWKRVLVTFVCVLLVLLAFHIVAGFAFVLVVLMTSIVKQHGPLFGEIDETTLAVFLVFYFVGLLYLVVILQLAGIVSVLENSCGIKAMVKSRLLLKGKMASGTIVVSAIWLSFGIILWLEGLVEKMGLSPSIIIWIFVLLKLLMLFLILVSLLWKFVLGIMLYFVCKSYHHESVDMLALSDQDHIPLRSS